MKLSTRLVLLVLGCLMPVLAAQIYSQVNLHAARRDQLSGLALRQAAMANADIGSIVSAVGQLGTTLEQFPEVLATGSECDLRLASLQHSLPQYRFLAVYGRNGQRMCGSDGAPMDWRGNRRWITDMADDTKAVVGPIVAGDRSDQTFLPIGVRIPGQPNQSGPDILIAALDATWVAAHLDPSRSDHLQPMAHATLSIADRDGTILARLPAHGDDAGRSLPAWLLPLARRETQGVETVTDPAGQTFIAAYVPTVLEPVGLSVIETLAVEDVTADIDKAAYQDLIVLGAAGVVALALAWVAGQRFIYQPTEALLRAARKWREGDLTARAALTDPGSEFAALAQSFNAMAAGLQARETERKLQASFLEAQVDERTRALSESNNRLQVAIAGREKTEAVLLQAQKLQAVGQLAGGIAHDFNNMLATVLGNLELMERRIGQMDKPWADGDSERMLRLIGRASGAVQRGSQLTSRLLAFSRRQRLAARPTDVNALLRDLIALAASTLGRRVHVVAELDDDLRLAMADPSQVEAAILNLCLNARDAMPEGGTLLMSTANIVVEGSGDGDVGPHLRPGNYVRIRIADTGMGMTQEVKARAFDPFFTTKGPAGSGLGLSQVYGMARQSDGDVTIDSTPGEGTRVTLFLPIASRAEQLAATTAQGAPGRATVDTHKGELVLVVDDDNEVRQVTVEMVRDLGCNVVEAQGGDQALAMIGTMRSVPSLILLDYAMPGMNGLQLFRKLRSRGITAPIALVTGYAELSETDIAANELAGLLRKPFTILELQGLMLQLCAPKAEPAGDACLEPGLTAR